jgi:hypothetical protein
MQQDYKKHEKEETMTYSQKVEKQAREIIRIIKPALRRKNRKYPTAWGNKTEDGLKAAIFNLIVAIDSQQRNHKTEGGERAHV